MSRAKNLVVAALLLCGAHQPAKAGLLTPGDILISTTGVSPQTVIYEYTPSGTRVQTIPVPEPGDGPNWAITVDPSGKMEVFNGTARPFLSTYDPATGSWQHQTFPGWSIYGGGLSNSGIAAYRNYVYVTDMMTTNGGEPNGIIRFDMTNHSAQRYAEGTDYVQLTAGKNGLVYAVTGNGNAVRVFDPLTMNLVRTINFPVFLTGIAVDAEGHIFASGAYSDSNLYEFDSNGNLLKRLTTPLTYMQSMDLSDDGQLAVGSNSGFVLFADMSLSHYRLLPAVNNALFVAWVAQPVPEPASVLLLGGASLTLLVYGRLRRK